MTDIPKPSYVPSAPPRKERSRPEGKRYIELIDKYVICQSDSDGYNPPSYIWTDNTGELIRCKDCSYYGAKEKGKCPLWCAFIYPEGYCFRAERKEE